MGDGNDRMYASRCKELSLAIVGVTIERNAARRSSSGEEIGEAGAGENIPLVSNGRRSASKGLVGRSVVQVKPSGDGAPVEGIAAPKIVRKRDLGGEADGRSGLLNVKIGIVGVFFFSDRSNNRLRKGSMGSGLIGMVGAGGRCRVGGKWSTAGGGGAGKCET
jgi:hypothetical protein